MGGRSNNFDVIQGRDGITYGKQFAQMEKELEALNRPRTPIGALPVSTEPPPRDRFSELTEDAQRYTRMIRDALRDIGTASYRLARLPVEAVLLAVRRFRPARK